MPSYLITFDGELLFHNGCRPFCQLRKWENGTNKEIIYKEIVSLFYESNKNLWNLSESEIVKLYPFLKNSYSEENFNILVKHLDLTWKECDITSFAFIPGTGSNDKLIEIMINCSNEEGWTVNL